jgi:isopenicillin-N N-acyltransferase like protein
LNEGLRSCYTSTVTIRQHQEAIGFFSAKAAIMRWEARTADSAKFFLPKLFSLWASLIVCLWAMAATAAQQPAERPFVEGRYERGELKYINDLPVLTVEGTPEQIGRQKAALTGDVAKSLMTYPKSLLKHFGREDQWPKIVEMGKLLVPQIPADHREELRAFAEKSGISGEQGIVANTLVDTYRHGFGCSSLLVEPERSATGGAIFGRNLDFYSMGVLEKYSLVTVHRPQGKHAFASIGFPGLFGCLSGINDAGLALAVHEVFLSRDFSPMFDPNGVPYTICFRRILEECATVAEAEKLLRNSPRTTKLNLALCDTKQSLVLEMTPKTVASRRGPDGLTACTNHFRTKDLVILPICSRYNTLMRYDDLAVLDLTDVDKALDQTNQGNLTVQTMIFEPGELVLHLAFGSTPSSSLPLKRLDLKPLLMPEKSGSIAKVATVEAKAGQ